MMGFLDTIFGGSEKGVPNMPNKTETPASTDIPAEHIAVIAAAIAAYMDAATAVSIPVIKIRRGLNVWAMTGRQEIMDTRKF